MEELDENKKKYLIIAIVLLIILGVFLIIHFNNRSLESGDIDKKKKNTTEKVKTTEVITTKKIDKPDEVAVENQDVYKSVIDDNNKFIYNYKLTDEIKDEDKIVSTVKEIDDVLLEKNIIGLYDISLFDSNGVKKAVNNSLINISIPITGNLVGYDEYKVVYIVDNDIQNEDLKTTVENNYINFSTTHLSLFGIIGIKNDVNENSNVSLNNVKVSLTQNNGEISKYASINDNIGINVVNADGIDYEVYYALKNNETNPIYKLYNNGLIFSDVVTPGEYTVIVKVVDKNDETNYKVFELDTFKVYDIVYKNVGETEETNIGTIMLDDEVESDYKDEESNNNIVIDEEEDTVIEEDKAVVNVKGNIYLVEATDISKLQMTGYLFIDTDEQITGTEQIDISNLERITITSEVFNYNGDKYTYSKDTNGNIIINKYVEVQNVDTGETTEELSTEDAKKIEEEFKNIFATGDENQEVVISIDEETNGLVIEKEIIEP